MNFFKLCVIIASVLTTATSSWEDESYERPIFYTGVLKDYNDLWEYMKHPTATTAWVTVHYCDKRYLIHKCQTDGLKMDSLIQVSKGSSTLARSIIYHSTKPVAVEHHLQDLLLPTGC